MSYSMHALPESGTPHVHQKEGRSGLCCNFCQPWTLQIIRASSGSVTCISKHKCRYRGRSIIKGVGPLSCTRRCLNGMVLIVEVINQSHERYVKGMRCFNSLRVFIKHAYEEYDAMITFIIKTYVNLFMSNLETRLLDSCVLTPLLWWRYIDNIFALWPHGEEHLGQFIEKINQFHPTIKFTAERSDKSVTFLDVKITPENGRLITDLHTKPTNTH